jgi:hypothetical protein
MTLDMCSDVPLAWPAAREAPTLHARNTTSVGASPWAAMDTTFDEHRMLHVRINKEHPYRLVVANKESFGFGEVARRKVR